MKSMIPTGASGVVKMTSLELVDFINSERKDAAQSAGATFPSKGFAKLEHDDFMRKVPEVLKEAAPKFSGTAPYRVNNAIRSRPIYEFPKRESCLMAMSYSYDIQAKVFDRMTAAEEGRGQAVDLNDAAALRQALLGYTEKVLALETTVKQQAPKVEFADALLNADGTTLVRDVAKTIGVGVRPLEKALREKGVILSNNAPAAQYVSKGYFKEDTHPYETKTRGTQISHTARVTGKGIEFIRRFVRRHSAIFGQTHGQT